MKKFKRNQCELNELFVSTHPELTDPDLHKLSLWFDFLSRKWWCAHMSGISKDKKISAMLVETRIANKENPVRSSCFTHEYISVWPWVHSSKYTNISENILNYLDHFIAIPLQTPANFQVPPLRYWWTTYAYAKKSLVSAFSFLN